MSDKVELKINKAHNIPTPVEFKISLFGPIANTKTNIEIKKKNKKVSTLLKFLKLILYSFKKTENIICIVFIIKKEIRFLSFSN